MRYQLAPVGEIHAQIRPVQHPGGKGIGPSKLARYGEEILEITSTVR